MIENVNPVARLRHIGLGDIIKLESSQSGNAILVFSKATDIPFVKAGVTFNFNKTETDPGKKWTTNLNGNLKTEMPKLNLGVILIGLESGEELIIGEMDLPVKDISAPQSLLSKQFQVNHTSWHEPYRLVKLAAS